MKPLLSVKHLTMQFGGLRAVQDFNLELNTGELVGLIGPNGAGKTTVFNMLTGVYEPSEGTIELEREGKTEVISGLPPHKITRKGLARTFQNIRLFKSMTVWENVAVARHFTVPYNLAQGIFRLPPFRKVEKTCAARFRTFWPSSRSTTRPTGGRPTFRTASNASSRSSAPWPAVRRCSCWTSPPQG